MNVFRSVNPKRFIRLAVIAILGIVACVTLQFLLVSPTIEITLQAKTLLISLLSTLNNMFTLLVPLCFVVLLIIKDSQKSAQD